MLTTETDTLARFRAVRGVNEPSRHLSSFSRKSYHGKVYTWHCLNHLAVQRVLSDTLRASELIGVHASRHAYPGLILLQ